MEQRLQKIQERFEPELIQLGKEIKSDAKEKGISADFSLYYFCWQEALELAERWLVLIGTNGIKTRADLARYLGVTRARVIQVLRRFNWPSGVGWQKFFSSLATSHWLSSQVNRVSLWQTHSFRNPIPVVFICFAKMFHHLFLQLFGDFL